MRAAQAARCAADQGKFWEVAGKIIANTLSLSPLAIDQFAKTGYRFRLYQNASNWTPSEAIRKRGERARHIGISGTPSFVIGRVSGDTLDGQKMVGAMPFSSFDAAIKSALAK